MAADLLFAAVAAANLHYAAHLESIERQPSSERPQLLALEEARHQAEMAALGCSSRPPCTVPLSDNSGQCGIQSMAGRRVPMSESAVDLGLTRWIAQSADDGGRGAPRGLSIGAGGDIAIAAKPGERPWFDPPNRFRAEFCGVRRFAKGLPIEMSFDFRIDPTTSIEGLDWALIAQIHQADMHFADGAYVQASPIFALSLEREGGGYALEVVGSTGRGPMREADIDPATGTQRTGPTGVAWKSRVVAARRYGRSAAFASGTWHHAAFSVVDAHGGSGHMFVKVDEAVVVDASPPTGFSYVEDLADVPYAGGRQDSGSYLKFGVYAGTVRVGQLPSTSLLSLRYRNLD